MLLDEMKIYPRNRPLTVPYLSYSRLKFEKKRWRGERALEVKVVHRNSDFQNIFWVDRLLKSVFSLETVCEIVGVGISLHFAPLLQI